LSTANGALLVALGTVVVVVVGAGVVVVTTAVGTVVVVVSLLLLLVIATAVPAAAAPAPTMPMTAPVPIVLAPTKPAGRLGKTATTALLRNGATGCFLHSCSERTTTGSNSAVRAGSKALFCAST
jgi:hypothetical protein